MGNFGDALRDNPCSSLIEICIPAPTHLFKVAYTLNEGGMNRDWDSQKNIAPQRDKLTQSNAVAATLDQSINFRYPRSTRSQAVAQIVDRTASQYILDNN